LISYELILSSAILLVVILTGSLSLTVNIEAQRAIWFIMPLFPMCIIFFIASIAETNRAPFDLAEAESELVSGFMTEHASVVFVFFFLAEYGSIVLICLLNTILFLGGYILDFSLWLTLQSLLHEALEMFNIPLSASFLYDFTSFFYFPMYDLPFIEAILYGENIEMFNIPLIEGILYSVTIGIKSCILIFIFIWTRASFPRIRYDQLMSFSWTILLPIVIAFIVLLPCVVYSFDIIPCNVFLL